MRKLIVTFAILILSSLGAINLSVCYQVGEEGGSLSPAEVAMTGDTNSVELERMATTTTTNSDKREEPLGEDYYQSSACQLVPVVHLLHHPGCEAKAIASFACSGSCISYVKTSSLNFWQHERSCSCCQQTGSREATFALDCPSLDPPYRKVKAHAPVECLCRACTDLGREDLRPQELVEALAGEKSGGFNFQTT